MLVYLKTFLFFMSACVCVFVSSLIWQTLWQTCRNIILALYSEFCNFIEGEFLSFVYGPSMFLITSRISSVSINAMTFQNFVFTFKK